VEPAGFTKVSALGVEEQRVWVVVEFEQPSRAWQSLGDAYRVETRVVVWRNDGVLQVPMSALFRRGNRWAVFVVHDGRAELRSVAIGASNSLSAHVRSGLSAGQKVIVHPPSSLTDGTRISE
jgi:HlyD family secretion protein